MNSDIPTLPGSVPNPEQTRLKATVDELRKNQLTTLNEAGKRVIELSTGMLGILFAVVAFGKDFPPPYLNNLFAQVAAVATLLLFFLALGSGFLCVQPQVYPDYPNNLDEMQKVLAKHHQWKIRCFQAGSIFFVLGAFWLVGLVITIIL